MKAKKALTCLMAAASIAAVGLLASSCKFGSDDDNNSALLQQILLQQQLAAQQQQNTSANLAQKIAAANGTLDLGGAIYEENVYLDKENFTLKNGNLGGKILTVTKSGVVLENISNARIVVDESVGDGDFTMKGCTNVVKLTVNGGGANSIHIADSEVQSLAAGKANVRVVLEGSASVASAEVKADGIKLEGNSGSKISKVSVSKTVKTITIQGGKIEKVITQAVVSIKIASSDTKIDTVKSSSLVKIEKEEGVEFENPEILEFENIIDEYESVKDDKISESGEEEEVEEPELSEEEEKELIPEIFELVSIPCSTGIRIQVKNLDGSDVVLREKTRELNRIDIFIDNIDVVRDLHKTDSTYEFYYPFVDAGTEIEVEARYLRNLKDEKGLTVWGGHLGRGKLNITPASGSGKINYEGEIEYDFSERGILNVTSAPSFAAQGGIKSCKFIFDVASGNSWEDGVWLGNLIFNPEEIPGEKDFYDVDYNKPYGADLVFISPYVSIDYEDPDTGRVWNMMHEYNNKQNLKLMSLAKRHETDIPETIELIPLAWAGGIKLKFTNVELSPEWSNRGDIFWINVNGDNIGMGTPDEEYYYPFVNPGEEVTVQIIHEVDIKDDNGNHTMKYIKAVSPKVKITPAGGLGKIVVSGELEYTADEYGILNITGIPSIEPAGVEWAIQFDFAEGKNWDEEGLWRGCVTVPGERLPGKANYYLDGRTESKDGFDLGFIGPLLIYYWTDPEGYRHEYRAAAGLELEYKFDYKLKSYDQMLSDGVVELPINISVTDTDDGLLIAAMDRSGENPYRFLTTSNNDQLRLVIDDKLVSIIGRGNSCPSFTKYPFVTPGKEIKIRLEHYQEDWNSHGEIIRSRIIESGEINYTPGTGRGEINCSGEFEFIVDEEGYGMVTVTKTPAITPALREGETWKLFFDFCAVENGDRMWYGQIHMPKEDAEDGIPCNVYDTAKGYVNNFSGFDSGIVEPYIVYYITDLNGSTREFRSYCFSDAILENVKLKSKNQVIAALGEDFSGFGN